MPHLVVGGHICNALVLCLSCGIYIIFYTGKFHKRYGKMRNYDSSFKRQKIITSYDKNVTSVILTTFSQISTYHIHSRLQYLLR